MPASGETIGNGEFKVYDGTEKDFVPRRVGLVHCCRLYHAAHQSIANATANVILAFNSEYYDTGAMHDPATNNSRITFQIAGVYAVKLLVTFAPNATGFRVASIKQNGNIYLASNSVAAVNGNDTRLSIETDAFFNVGDYVEAEVYQNSGAALQVYSTPVFNSLFRYSPIFSARQVSL